MPKVFREYDDKLLTEGDQVKRVIKYHSPFKGDRMVFSCSSTKYEIMPILVDDNSGLAELKEIAKQLKLRTKGEPVNVTKPSRNREVQVTHAVALTETVKNKPMFKHNPVETYEVYLGFVQLLEVDGLPAKETIDNPTPKGLLYDLVNGCAGYDLGIHEYGESLDGETWLTMSGWQFYHHIPMLGYSMEKFLKREKIDDTYFADSVSQCSACNVYDHNDNGYTYNHRHTNDGTYGIKCGCYGDYCENNIESFVNNTKTPMELEAAEKLEEAEKLEHLERFIGGMVDGRGGHYAGEATREGTPESVLREFKMKFPKTDFVFTHDESGQFQTYFSIWRVLKSKPKTKKRKAG